MDFPEGHRAKFSPEHTQSAASQLKIKDKICEKQTNRKRGNLILKLTHKLNMRARMLTNYPQNIIIRNSIYALITKEVQHGDIGRASEPAQ